MARKGASYSSSTPIHRLFVLNVCLQLFDGLATYQGLQLGWQEGNPLLHNFMMRWGVEWTLLVFKGKACILLLLLHRVRREELAIVALAVAAGCYFFFSFLPWLSCLVFLTPPDY